MKGEIDGVAHFSFTTDVWTTNVSNDSLLSLTAHWLTDSFARKTVVLHIQLLEEAHTGVYLAEKLTDMLDSWEIPMNKVHLVLRDNGANMVKAMRDASLPAIGCFAHTLQLVVHDGVLSQRAVNGLLAVCRKIVGHFKHSTVAYHRLKEIQQTLGLPQHRLKQDEPTRWNSSLYMIQSVIEQKVALAAYATEHGIAQLSAHQLDLANKVVAALLPVEEITKSISADAASVSVVLPYIRMLTKSLEKHHHDDGVQGMKREMLKSLRGRYGDAESNEFLVCSSFLDPHFKDKCFSSGQVKTVARELLQQRLSALSTPVHASENIDSEEPAPKRSRTALLECFSEILQEAGASVSEDSENEIARYLSEPLIEFHKGNQYLTWWANNQNRFPSLAKLAQKYLCAPPTSVPSERLFSLAGDVYDEKRNRLAPERAETLLFIN